MTHTASAYAVNGGHDPANHGQFSKQRFAFLFKPGEYDVDCPVGYYTQVLGLGKLQVTLLLAPRKAYILKNKTFRAAGHYRLFGDPPKISKHQQTTNGMLASE